MAVPEGSGPTSPGVCPGAAKGRGADARPGPQSKTDTLSVSQMERRFGFRKVFPTRSLLVKTMIIGYICYFIVEVSLDVILTNKLYKKS